MHRNAKGFSLAELVIAMAIIGILTIASFTFFVPTLNQYFSLERDGLTFSQLAIQSQRIAKVLRGLTDITAANSNDISVYAYFSPHDAYVSLIHYYLNAGQTQMLADVTPMSANPPNGTLLTAQQKTYTIVDNFYSSPSVSTFVYMDDAGNALTLPITDLHTIKAIRVNLVVPQTQSQISGSNTINVQVSLRNRKTNL